MKIAIVMPAGADKRSGNRNTAQRWAGFLRSLGHRVSVASEWTGGDAGVLIALHARKSYPSIERFHRLRPGAPLIVVLTGTDLYRDIATSDEAKRSLAVASRLIVLQDRGRRELAQRYARFWNSTIKHECRSISGRPCRWNLQRCDHRLGTRC